jgi:glyoxylase I family protein
VPAGRTSFRRGIETIFGIDPTPWNYGQPRWRQQPGPTVFAPSPTTLITSTSGKAGMINFRVLDLDRMVAQLREAGILAEVHPPHPNGRFARLYDRENNSIELSEPAGRD